MYIKNKGKLFQLVQNGGHNVHPPNRAYATKAQPQAYLTKNYNLAKEGIEKHHGASSPYWDAFLDLNNFEIIEYVITEKCRHKHPLIGV